MIINRLSELLNNESIILTLEDKLNLVNSGIFSSNMYGFKLDTLLDISNYYKLDDDIKNAILPVVPEGYEDIELGYLNILLDYISIINIDNEKYSDIYFNIINLISIKVNKIIFNYKLFEDINKILRFYINISEESDKICNEMCDILVKVTNYSETDSSFLEIIFPNITNEYNDIVLIEKDVDDFINSVASGDVRTELFDKIFVVLSLRLQSIYDNYQYLGKIASYISEEMYTIPNTFCVSALKLGILTCFGLYPNSQEIKRISSLYRRLLDDFDLYKEQLIKENTSIFLIEGIRDEIIFRNDEISLGSDSIYSKIINCIRLVNKVSNVIYNDSIK
jgi:hypothetical protein